MPTNLNVNINSKALDKCGEIIRNLLNSTVSRLSLEGVSVSWEKLFSGQELKAADDAVAAAIDVVTDATTIIIDTRQKMVESFNSRINENQQDLLQEAESKVTGLNYGIIGDSLNLLVYGIEDYRTKQKQRKKAYAEAERLHTTYYYTEKSSANIQYAKFMDSILWSWCSPCFVD